MGICRRQLLLSILLQTDCHGTNSLANKIIIQETLRSQVLTLGHEVHPDETVMKRRLRAKWSYIDREVEKLDSF